MLKNKYQSWIQYLKGEWKCPKCNVVWDGLMALDNFVLYTTQLHHVKKRLECPCGFMEQL